MTSSSTSSVFSALAPYDAEGLLAGRVVRVDRGQCDIVTADGLVRADTAFVTPHDPLRVVCTGDWVALDPEGHHPRYVRTYLPRRTAFVRSTSSERSEGQILAANVDHAVIAVSVRRRRGSPSASGNHSGLPFTSRSLKSTALGQIQRWGEI